MRRAEEPGLSGAPAGHRVEAQPGMWNIHGAAFCHRSCTNSLHPERLLFGGWRGQPRGVGAACVMLRDLENH